MKVKGLTVWAFIYCQVKPLHRNRCECPRHSWLEQICRDSGSSPADVWHRTVKVGHGAVLQPKLAMHRW